jgi:hypothetical protein
MYNYYAMLFRKIQESKTIKWEMVDEYKKADGTVMKDVMLVSTEIIGTKPIYKLEMQEKFLDMVCEPYPTGDNIMHTW